MLMYYLDMSSMFVIAARYHLAFNALMHTPLRGPVHNDSPSAVKSTLNASWLRDRNLFRFQLRTAPMKVEYLGYDEFSLACS